MREDCKHFHSRTYVSGEVARWCALDLAPEAPWRCPEDCRSYTRRRTDVAWSYGSLTRRPETPPEPEIIETSDDAAALLDEAEDIVNAIGPEALDEARRQRERQRSSRGFIGRFRGRFRRR